MRTSEGSFLNVAQSSILLSHVVFIILPDFSFKIRVFYGSHEVLSTETRLTEGERRIRFSYYGSSKVLDAANMDGAKQINLPEVDSNCQEIVKVMSFLAPGILLEVTEDFDLLATRLAALRVINNSVFISVPLTDQRRRN